MIYVLIVISSVNYGQSVTMQPFSSKEKCEAAEKIVRMESRKVYLHSTVCVEG